MAKEKKKAFRSGVRKKFVWMTLGLSFITYSISALFLYFVFNYVDSFVGETLFTIGTLVLGVIWSGILAYFFAGFIVRRLYRLQDAAEKAAAGDLDQVIDIGKTDDEIRALGASLQKMMTNIGTMILHVETNFQHTNEKVLAMTDESQKAAQQSVAISETIAQISAGAENSATAVQMTVASVEEVTRIAGEVLHQAKSTKDVSQGMVEELGKSRGVISSLVEGISVLAKEHEVSLQSVHQLEEHARKVEQIISMVGDIAEQTNLLALNASIEAARAGEHGKGFAVVAEEVRQLADESAKAVKGISGLVQNIQREVKQVVAHITEQVSSAQSEAKKGEETNSAMEAMTKSVNDVAGAVEMISTLVDEQMTQIQKTSSQSQEVAAIAEQTSAGAQQVATATEEQTAVMRAVEELAQELQAQAAQLKETIDQLNR